MEVGSIAELVSALAGLGALVAAIVAVIAARKANRQQQSELRMLAAEQEKRKETEERSVSAKVAVWARTDKGEAVALRYINASELPVYELTVRVVIPGHSIEIPYTVIGPSSQSRSLRRGSVELQDEVARRCGAVDWMWLLKTGNIAASITFRDLSNVWWHRAFSGLLTRCSSAREAGEAADQDVEAWLARREEHVCQR